MNTLEFLYGTAFGRILLRPLAGKHVSALSGRLLDTGASKVLIPVFIRRYHMDVSEYDLTRIHSFNDFFCRPIKPGMRPVDMEPGHLIAPCDGLLKVYTISEDRILPVKQSTFTLKELLQDENLAKRYEGGTCAVFRLCVNHYHRYCYADTGRKSGNCRISGRFHTVRPVALAHRPVFTQNAREYTLIRTARFGTILQMEVGAMLVGRIRNLKGAGQVIRGEEKGMFQYGGSTIILLLEKEKVRIRQTILEASLRGEEIPVRMGEWIGTEL